jgi:glyoxylase-like metal-dependent hydrolase (beta-lactamase superfamily II)
MPWSVANRKIMLIRPFPKIGNIHAFGLPLPDYPELITANIYAVGKGPITLIDTGPKSPGSLEFIKEQLNLLGLELSDVERILITHGHIDHAGLSMKIIEVAGRPIDCFIHSEDKWRISKDNYQEHMWNEERENFLALMNVPQKEIEKVRNRFYGFRELCDPLEDISTMEDGDEFIGDGYHLITVHTPGHTTGACCFYEPNQRILFSGDTIIKHITPNPLTEVNRRRLKNPNYQSLGAYSDSLDKLLQFDVRFVFPGHGEYIEDLKNIISSYKAHHQERMGLVWNALNKEKRPIYNIIDDVFPEVPEGDTFLAVSEIFVHLEILINEGKAELVDAGPPALYRAL